MVKCSALLMVLLFIQWGRGRPIGYRDESVDFEYSSGESTSVDYDFEDDDFGPWVQPLYTSTLRTIGFRQCVGLLCKWRQQSYTSTPVPQYFGPLEHVQLSGECYVIISLITFVCI